MVERPPMAYLRPLPFEGSLLTETSRYKTELSAILQYLSGILQVRRRGLLYDMVQIVPAAPSLQKVETAKLCCQTCYNSTVAGRLSQKACAFWRQPACASAPCPT